MGSVSALRTAVSTLVDRVRFGRQHGLSTFNGRRNVAEALGYADVITLADYRERYERSEVGATVVEAMPNACWRGGGELVENESADPEDVTDFELAWFTLADRLKIWPLFRRADIVAGLGRYSVVLIGGPGADLTQELPRANSKRAVEQIGYLSVFSEADATIDPGDLETDFSKPRYGFPNFYRVAGLVPGRSKDRKGVHWTRMIHVADGLLENDLYGRPRMLRVWNRLDDVEKVVGGGSEAYWQRVQPGMQLDIDKDVWADLQKDPVKLAAAKKAMEDEADEYVHGMRRFMRTSGVKLTELGSDVAAFHNQLDAIIMLISAGTGIPKRILTGSERGQLASTQDDSNWDERVQDRRGNWCGGVVRQFVDRLVNYGYLPKPAQYDIRWPEIADLDEHARAEIALTYAKANQAAGTVVVTSNEIRDRVIGLPPLDEPIPGEPAAVAPPEPITTDVAEAIAASKKKSLLTSKLSIVRRTSSSHGRAAS